MILRDCLVRAGIVTSDRVCRMPPHVQLFFRNLLHVCDGAGRFEARAAILRAVLYAPSLHKVSERDVQGWLTQCHEAGLIKLYTVGGAGYGKVPNYGQRDTKRRILYPPEDGEQLPLAPPDPEPDPKPSEREEKRRDFKTPQAPQPGTASNAPLDTDPREGPAWRNLPEPADVPDGCKRLPPSLAASPEFRACWEKEWLPYLIHVTTRVPSIITLDRHLQQCVQWGPERAVKALHFTIETGRLTKPTEAAHAGPLTAAHGEKRKAGWL